MTMNAHFLTEREVAERTQISLATLRRWRLEKRGPKFRKFGSLVRYPEGDLAQWEQAQPEGGAGFPGVATGRDGGRRPPSRSCAAAASRNTNDTMSPTAGAISRPSRSSKRAVA